MDFSATAENCNIKLIGSNVVLCDAQGNKLMTFTGINFTWSSPKTNEGTVNKTDKNTYQINYNIEDDPSEKVKVSGLFQCKNNKLE